MESKLKKIMSICLFMVLVFRLSLPVYADPTFGFGCLDDYEFDKTTGHLFIGKDIECKTIKDYLNSFWFAPFSLEDIKSVMFKDGLTSISCGTFSGCTGLTSITIPDSVTCIREWAFLGCSNLKKVIIPDSVTYIGDDAFDNDCVVSKYHDLTIGKR